jgi:hypothetical protein
VRPASNRFHTWRGRGGYQTGCCVRRGVGTSVADPKQKFRILFRIRIRPEVSFGSGSGFGSGFESGFESQIRIRLRILDPDLDQKLAKFFFFLLKFLRSLIFKAALHQLCVRKKLAIYEDLTHICILSVYSVPPPCR